MKHQLLIDIQEITNRAHDQVDFSINKVEKVCKKGCDSCCHQIVDVLTWEEPKVLDYIKNNIDRKTKREISRNLNKWFKLFNKNTRDADRSNPLNLYEINQVQCRFREKRVPCPFLIKSECAIYEARPMVCRVHYQQDSANNCSANPHLISPEASQDIFRNASRLFDPNKYPVATKPLTYLVAEEFDVKTVSKPMAGVIFDPRNMFARI